MQIGFHTDAFNSSYWNFDKCLAWAEANGIHFIECGLIDGVSWIHGLGYQPHIALYQDPLLLRRKMERLGVQFSQLDAAYPLSGSDGPLYGVPYVLKSIPWAKLAGCPRIATTDGLHKPEGLSDDEAMELMKRSLRPDCRGGRGLRDHRQYRGPRLFYDQPRAAWSKCWPSAVRPTCG